MSNGFEKGIIPASKKQWEENGKRYQTLDEVLMGHIIDDIDKGKTGNNKEPDIDYRGLIPRDY